MFQNRILEFKLNCYLMLCVENHILLYMGEIFINSIISESFSEARISAKVENHCQLMHKRLFQPSSLHTHFFVSIDQMIIDYSSDET